MERITRTLTLLEIETPNGEVRHIAPSDILCRNAYIKGVK